MSATIIDFPKPLGPIDTLLAGLDPDDRADAIAAVRAYLQSQPAKHHPPAFVLPPIRLDDLMRDHFGMNDRQTNMAWRGVIRDREALGRYSRLLDRQIVLSREIEATLYDMRDMLLRAMWQKYPAAARRIIAGLQRNDRTSAVDEAGSPR
jgi:hypothetical protein